MSPQVYRLPRVNLNVTQKGGGEGGTVSAPLINLHFLWTIHYGQPHQLGNVFRCIDLKHLLSWSGETNFKLFCLIKLFIYLFILLR